MTTEEKTIMRKEVAESCKMIGDSVKSHLNHVEFLHNHFFADMLVDEEMFPCWMMTGECLQLIISNMKATIESIERGEFIPEELREVPA